MKVAWAVAAGALLSVPILAWSSRAPVRAEPEALASPADRTQPRKPGIRLVVDQDGDKRTLRIEM